MATLIIAEHDQSNQIYKVMIILATIITIWMVLMVLIVGACLAARLGDQAQQEPSPPLTSQSDTHTARLRPHPAIRPDWLRSQHGLSRS
jgi:hypothetical protein